jgi:hypothetical protein
VTTEVRADVAIVDPATFDAVTVRRMKWPASAALSVYLPRIAVRMSVHAVFFAVHRCH